MTVTPRPAARLAALLKRRDILLVCTGQTISQLGNGVFNVALAWQLLRLHGNSFDIGLVLGLNVLVTVLLAFPAGALADRVSPRVLVATADGLAAVVLTLLGVAAWTGDPGLGGYIAAAVALGMTASVFQPAYFKYRGLLAVGHDAAQVNSLLSVTGNLARLAGPAVGGTLLAVGAGPACFVVDAVSFAVAAACVIATRVGARAPRSRPGHAPTAARERIWPLLRRNSWLVPILVITLFANMLCVSVLRVGLPSVSARLGGGPALLGLLSAVLVLGEIAGGLLVSVGVFSRMSNAASLLALSAVLAGGFAIPAAGLSVASQVIGCAAVGVGFSLDIFAESIMQTRLPQALLGRAASIAMIVSFGPMPLGLILSGAFVNAVGVRATYAVASGVMLAVLAIIARPLLAGTRDATPIGETA